MSLLRFPRGKRRLRSHAITGICTKAITALTSCCTFSCRRSSSRINGKRRIPPTVLSDCPWPLLSPVLLKRARTSCQQKKFADSILPCPTSYSSHACSEASKRRFGDRALTRLKGIAASEHRGQYEARRTDQASTRGRVCNKHMSRIGCKGRSSENYNTQDSGPRSYDPSPRCWIQELRQMTQNFKSRIRTSRHKTYDPGPKTHDPEFSAQDTGPRAHVAKA